MGVKKYFDDLHAANDVVRNFRREHWKGNLVVTLLSSVLTLAISAMICYPEETKKFVKNAGKKAKGTVKKLKDKATKH